MNYRKNNNLVGWIVFGIATIVYLLTIERTVSFWDCGEFILAANKLQVVHPPGAALYLMIGRIFTLFSFGDPTKVALMMNVLSALCSSFTILFLFWTITALAKKLVKKTEEVLNVRSIFTILGAGVVGALAFTFCDSFWFSAVEGEVYAMSSLFTAAVVWGIMKWEAIANEPGADRWLIFIALMIGLSTGVHLLNLLAIPAIIYVYYFKKYEFSTKGLIACFLLSAVILLFIMEFIIKGLPSIGAKFELLFVNNFELPFGSGMIFFLLLVIGLLVFGMFWAKSKNHPNLNTIFIAVAMILIGYSSIGMIVARSNADTPVNMNNPSNVFTLLSYLNREQYGDTPLFKGPYFTSFPKDTKVTGKRYDRGENEYEVVGENLDYVWDENELTVFPRVHDWRDQNGGHKEFYRNWLNLRPNEKPTFGENLGFFFSYQMNAMYWRYFMWNFSGRQNDFQGHGRNKRNGNWLTGINFIDSGFLGLGDQSDLPPELEGNKGNNKFFMIPFILGLLGFFYHLKHDKKDWFVVFMLFFFTGIAIVLYLNQTPLQPRERDYAYAGSFMAFCIWIGLSVFAILDIISSKMKGVTAPLLATGIGLIAPALMAQQGWNDHDRSKQRFAHDFAVNYLESCAPNAILFTQGDNDTYPLWYAQEVEGVRTDVRIVNLSLLSVDWYINQLRKKQNDALPVPMSFDSTQIKGSKRDVVRYFENPRIAKDRYFELSQIMDAIGSDDPKAKTRTQGGLENYLPTKNLAISIDKQKILVNGHVAPEDDSLIVSQMRWQLPKNALIKSDLMMLNIIAENNFERPVHIAISVGPGSYLGLQKYFQLEGLTYRVVPIEANPEHGQIGRVRDDVMYENMMNIFNWGGLENPDHNLHLDEQTRRLASNFRRIFYRLAEKLASKGENEKAANVINKLREILPHDVIPYDVFSLQSADLMYDMGYNDQAEEILNQILNQQSETGKYVADHKGSVIGQSMLEDLFFAVYSFQEGANMAREHGNNELADRLEQLLMEYGPVYRQLEARS